MFYGHLDLIKELSGYKIYKDKELEDYIIVDLLGIEFGGFSSVEECEKIISKFEGN